MMMMVARGRVVITLRVIVQGLIAVGMRIGVVIGFNDAQWREARVVVSHLCCVLDVVNNACGRRAGEHERQRHTQRRKHPSDL